MSALAATAPPAPIAPPPSHADACASGTAAAGTAAGCAGCPNAAACASAAGKPQVKDPTAGEVNESLAGVKHIWLVLSGKGGVGKSSVSCQLAQALAARGAQVGILDVDICGPSVPRMLGLVGSEVHQSSSGWSPVYADENLGVMSVGFMLPNADDAVIWRGPKKNGLIKQFLRDVDWGELDYLIVDTPPGTSDEHLSIVQYLAGTSVDGAVVVTTPQEVALADVRKELNFCTKTKLNVLGVVENMAELVLPLAEARFAMADGADASAAVRAALAAAGIDPDALSVVADVFKAAGGGGEKMAANHGVPFLGRLPMDTSMAAACDAGRAVAPASAAGRALGKLVDTLTAGHGTYGDVDVDGDGTMDVGS